MPPCDQQTEPEDRTKVEGNEMYTHTPAEPAATKVGGKDVAPALPGEVAAQAPA